MSDEAIIGVTERVVEKYFYFCLKEYKHRWYSNQDMILCSFKTISGD